MIMYNAFFGITESPFSLAPDPSYLYLSEKHRTALAHLLYCARGGSGFTVLTGEVGTGKTTLCRAFLEQLPEQADSALILNPRLSESELLASICGELGIEVSKDASIKDLIDALNAHLLESYRRGRDTIVLIDEAQNLSPGVLEQIRLLTNLETSKRKLLQLVLVGQPELADMLARKDLRQLAQRITARYHLDTLDREETASLIRHRLNVAGLSERTFDGASLSEIHRHAGGVPRLIVILAERCLLGAYAEGIRTVDRRMVQKAAREVIVKPRRPRPDPNSSRMQLRPKRQPWPQRRRSEAPRTMCPHRVRGRRTESRSSSFQRRPDRSPKAPGRRSRASHRTHRTQSSPMSLPAPRFRRPGPSLRPRRPRRQSVPGHRPVSRPSASPWPIGCSR